MGRVSALGQCFMVDCRRVTCASCVVMCVGCKCEICKKCHEHICTGTVVPGALIKRLSVHVERHEFRHKLNRPFFSDCNVSFQ